MQYIQFALFCLTLHVITTILHEKLMQYIQLALFCLILHVITTIWHEETNAIYSVSIVLFNSTCNYHRMS